LPVHVAQPADVVIKIDNTRNAGSSDTEKLIEEARAKQSNTVWPDTLLNGRSVDEFLLKGSPDAPIVQRIGAWIFGLF